MTEIDPYRQPDGPPSWAVPIALGAGFTLFMVSAAVVFGGGPNSAGSACTTCFCAPFAVPFVGAVPAFVASRRDPSLTPGQGFAVAFIAVGLGALVWSVALAFGLGTADYTDLQDTMRQELQRQGHLGSDEIEEMVGMVPTMARMAPVVAAGILTLGGGGIGMIVTALLRASRPRNGGAR